MLGTVGMAALLPHVFNIPADSVFEARVTLLLTGGSIAQSFVFNVFVGVLMGLRRYYLVSRMGIVFSLLRSGLIVLALKAGYGIIALGLIQFALGTLMGGIVVWYALKFLPTYRPRLVRPERAELTRIFNYSRFVVGNNLGEKLIFSTDALVIGTLQPVSMLTYYAIAGSLIGYLRNLMQASASVLNPETSAWPRGAMTSDSAASSPRPPRPPCSSACRCVSAFSCWAPASSRSGWARSTDRCPDRFSRCSRRPTCLDCRPTAFPRCSTGWTATGSSPSGVASKPRSTSP